MHSQIFKKDIPKELLFNLLDDLCIKYDKYYIFNNYSFKKGVYENKIDIFIEEIKSYYHNSKKKYVERNMNYNNFVTILRQICNYLNLSYTSVIKYCKSDYNIQYYIYF